MAERVWRAITASGIVPSTMVGSTRCETAEAKAPFSPDIRLSISMKPVGWGKKNIRLMRPDTGVHCSQPETTMINSSAHQKIGIE